MWFIIPLVYFKVINKKTEAIGTAVLYYYFQNEHKLIICHQYS